MIRCADSAAQTTTCSAGGCGFVGPVTLRTREVRARADYVPCDGAIDVRAAGVYQVRLQVPQEYPLAPPRAFFQTPIFHPNIHFEVRCAEQ